MTNVHIYINLYIHTQIKKVNEDEKEPFINLLQKTPKISSTLFLSTYPHPHSLQFRILSSNLLGISSVSNK